jgi:hypothetical protein
MGLKRWLLLVGTIAVGLLYFVFTREFGHARYLSTALDEKLPFVPILVLPYLLFIPIFWGTLLYSFITKKQFERFALSIIAVYLIAYIVYILYSTGVVRPEVTGSGWSSRALAYLYAHDRPYGALPSLHTTSAVLLSIYFWVTRNRFAGIWTLYCLVVIVSTVLIRQH